MRAQEEEVCQQYGDYLNVMELLVAEEVERQLKQLPERLVAYVNVCEVETFALNRLPVLYAASEKGLRYQRYRALRELQPQIVEAVRQALIAVQLDPLRQSQPLPEEPQPRSAAVLQALQDWFNDPELSWQAAGEKLQALQRNACSAA